ncbi:PP2C family protein-serine/threonine phosphatase [Streptomyces sp. NPDC050145]|uniref:PP2C family protein-serine/threonine phosphatase n=1 Tax=Streptomyces sp. NPDC050145 TaxID=3365602 RepID=UPI00379AA03C
MDHSSSVPDARARLELGAIKELLLAQRRRVLTYARDHDRRARPPATEVAPRTAAPVTTYHPSGQEVLDALPMPALLLQPVTGADGEISDVLHVSQNAEAVAHLVVRLHGGSPPLASGPVSLYERFPALRASRLPELIARAHRLREPQGPATVEWMADGGAQGPVRVNDEIRVAPCGPQLLLTWERGNRLRMAAAAQHLVRTCWAEWNLGDDGIEPSRGFRQVIGLPPGSALPTLGDLASAVTNDSLPGYYQMLYDVILRKRTASSDLRLRGQNRRIVRMTAEPVRIAPGSLVWAVRAVLSDVTAERRRRETAERTALEARRQRQRVETLTEVAEALREAVLPHFQDELATYGLQAAVVYRPDAREAGVGGDWYKARRVPDGRLLIALGDARGHGLAAVTLMAKLRYALAGLTYTEQPVEQLTRWLNEAACADGDESTATAIVARYHPEGSVLRWTCAGHPRPVLIRDGRAAVLPSPEGGPGLSLGVLPGTSYTAVETPLRVDDIVLMYSDGLTERRPGDPDRDTARFLAQAQDCFHASPPPPGRLGLLHYAEQLVERLDGPHRDDDATLLALRRVDP